MSTRCRYLLVLGLVCLVFFLFGNGHFSLTGHDETFYAQTAKEMAQRGEWLTPYLFDQPQFEKPILLYWCLRAAGEVLGFNSFAMRLFPALFAALGIAAVYLLGVLGFGNERKAFLAALILASSILFVGLARTVFTDMLFCVLILLSIVAFYWGHCRAERRTAGILLFFAFSGFAVLAKGPLGILLPLLIVVLFLLIRGDMKAYRSSTVLWGILLFTLIAGPWYAIMISRHGSQFTHEFFFNDHWRRLVEAEHEANDTWYFYPACMIGAMFPWSLFVVSGVIHVCRMLRRHTEPIHVLLGLHVLVILLVFQVAHSKLISYVFPALPALALITADWLVDSENPTGRLRRGILIAGATTGLLLSLLIPSLMIVGQREYGLWSTIGIAARIGLLVACISSAGAGLAHLYLLTRGKVTKASYVLTATVPILLLTLGVLSAMLEPYISSSTICGRFLKRNTGDETVLCSKALVRAVRYYTGRDVAAMSMKGRVFFSPHPIPLFTTAEQVEAFLRSQALTYCIVKHSDAARLERIMGNRFLCTRLDAAGDALIMRINSAHAETAMQHEGLL